MKLSKIVFTILIITNIIGVTFVAEKSYDNIRIKEDNILNTYTERLKFALENEIIVAKTLGTVIEDNMGEITPEYFHKLSRVLTTGQVEASTGYLPHGILMEVYPTEGNTGAIGNNVFRNEDTIEDATKARDSRQVIVSGPYKLLNNTKGLIIRNPLYVDGVFIGFTVVALDAQKLFKYVGIENLKNLEYEFELTTSYKNTKIVATVSDNFKPVYANYKEFVIGENQWKFGLYIEDKYCIVLSEAALWFLIFLLINFILYYYLQKFEASKEILIRKLEKDSLTGAYNRPKLQEFIKNNGNTPYLLLYLDLDKFKLVNEIYGHKSGDKLLIALVRRLQAELKSNTIISRVEGDEFAILAPGIVEEEIAQNIIRRITRLAEHEFSIDKIIINVSISIGQAFSGEANTLEELLRLADNRMRENKEKSRKK